MRSALSTLTTCLLFVLPSTAYGERGFGVETFDDGVELTVDVGVELGIPEELLIRFGLIEVEHEDVTCTDWPVTDHAHIEPSYLPHKIIGRASAPAFVLGCASPLKIGPSFSEEVGVAPWEEIEFALVVED